MLPPRSWTGSTLRPMNALAAAVSAMAPASSHRRAKPAALEPGVGPQRAEAEQQRVEAGDVIGLAAGGEHDHHKRQVGDREAAIPPPALRAQEADQARQPHGHEQRAHERELERDEAAAAPLFSALGLTVRDRRLGHAVGDLPRHVGEGAQQRERRTRGRPARPQERAGADHQERADDRRHKDADQQLVEQADPQHGAGDHPQPLVFCAQQPHEQPADDAAERQVKGLRGEEVARREHHERRRATARGDRLRPPPATGFARDQPRAHDRRDPRQRGRDPQREQRARRQHVHRPRHHRRQQRLIGVAERQVAAGLDEVELVAVVPVATAHREQRSQHDAGDRQDRRPGDPRQRRGGRQPARGDDAEAEVEALTRLTMTDAPRMTDAPPLPTIGSLASDGRLGDHLGIAAVKLSRWE